MGKVIRISPTAVAGPARQRLHKQLARARHHIDQDFDRIAGVVTVVIRDDGTSYVEVADTGLSPLAVIGALHRAIIDQS